MNKLKYILCLALAIVGLSIAPLSASYAVVDINDAKQFTQDNACKNIKNCDEGNPLSSIFRTVANILLFLVGAVAVIMLIIGGFRYVTSNGDAGATKGARDTILYAIIGIIVAFLAYAAVNFVASQLSSGAK